MRNVFRVLGRVRAMLIRKRFGRLGKGYLALTVDISNPERIFIEDGFCIRERVWLNVVGSNGRHGRIEIGRSCHFAREAIISSAYAITIGDEVTIGPRAMILDNNHGYQKKNVSVMKQGIFGAPVAIGSFSWIGGQAIILLYN